MTGASTSDARQRRTPHLATAAVQTTLEGAFIGWYPYCATCDQFGAWSRDEAMATEVANAHMADYA